FCRFKLRDSSLCRYCPEEQDDAYHTFFACPRWQNERRSAEIEARIELSPENIVKTMLQSPRMWNVICTMTSNIVTQKENDERRIATRNI
ncbi:MAG: hypothetical protein KTM48_02050, partial [Wolbachia endosymbiont of Pissodes strobi]|nr:hypothetical protein [Wolbachia endosymbiont of Pissodes strobi]